jgi:hypothetical protein
MHKVRHQLLTLLFSGSIIAGCGAADSGDISGPENVKAAQNAPAPTAQFSGGSWQYKYLRNIDLASGDALIDPFSVPEDFDPMTLDLDNADGATTLLPIDASGFQSKIVFYAKQAGNSPAKGYFKAYDKFMGMTLSTVAGKVTCVEVDGKIGRVEGVITHSTIPEDKGQKVFWTVQDNGYRWTDWDDDDRDHYDDSSQWSKPRDQYSGLFRYALPPAQSHCDMAQVTPLFKSEKGNIVAKEYWYWAWVYDDD